MPIADGVPYSASADPSKYTDLSEQHWNKYWQPSKASDYADFVATIVNRYKVMGVHTYEPHAILAFGFQRQGIQGSPGGCLPVREGG